MGEDASLQSVLDDKFACPGVGGACRYVWIVYVHIVLRDPAPRLPLKSTRLS